MANIQGIEVLSNATRRDGKRLMIASFIALLVKLYRVDLGNLSIFDLSFPSELFDTILIIIIIFGIYTYTVNWLFDVESFRNWYTQRAIWSQFQTNMEIDHSFYSEGVALLEKLDELERKKKWPDSYDDLDDKIKKEHESLKQNIELFILKLQEHNKNFCYVSRWGRFYVFVQWGIIPMFIAIAAIVALLIRGSFIPPAL